MPATRELAEVQIAAGAGMKPRLQQRPEIVKARQNIKLPAQRGRQQNQAHAQQQAQQQAIVPVQKRRYSLAYSQGGRFEGGKTRHGWNGGLASVKGDVRRKRERGILCRDASVQCSRNSVSALFTPRFAGPVRTQCRAGALQCAHAAARRAVYNALAPRRP